MINILLADDHPVFRSGIKAVLSTNPELKIICEVNDGLEAVDGAKRLKPDLIIMDINMPNLNGIDAAKKIKSENSNIKILLLTMHVNPNYIFEALSAGIEGYISKASEMEDVIKGINSIVGGEEFFSPDVTKYVMKSYQQFHNKKQKTDKETPYLTKRETEIIKWITYGLNYKQIAEKLFISHYTVINHRQNIIQKLELKSNAELIRFAIQNSIVDN